MFLLLKGLLLQPQRTIAALVQQRSMQQASRVNFILLVLLMINTAFLVGSIPEMDQYLGSNGKWLLALLSPPLQYYVQRLFFVWSTRLGLAMFAGSKLPKDPIERRDKQQIVKMMFPYVYYPMLFFSIISSLFSSVVLANFFVFLGLLYMFLLLVATLRTIYGVSPAVALWGPLLVQFLISLCISLIVFVVVLIYTMLTNFHFAP